MENQKKFAVLIDADNVSPERFERIFGEISLLGTATYRRIYGNWAEYNRSMLKEKLVEYALTPVQQFNYIKGKNATDIAMVIEAMDILYTGEVDGFAIVTNDSDFTRLALRLRESGMTVIGMGDDVAPASFRAACTDFIVLRESRRIAEERIEQRKLRLSARKPSLRTKAAADGVSTKKAAEHASPKPEEAIDETEQITVETVSEVPVVNEAPAATDKVLSDRELRSAIRDFLFECEEDDGWFSASTMVNKLKEKFPSLDIKDYADLPLFAGKRKIWTTYFLALGFCENKQKGPSNYLLRLKPEERRKLAAERGTDSSESENAVAQSVAEKSAAEKAPEISAAAEPAQNVSPAKKTSSGRRGRPRGKAGSKAENAEAKTAVAKPEAKSAAAKPESKDAVAKPEAKTAVAKPEAKTAVAKPEAKTAVAKPEAKTAVAKPEATAENNAAPGSKRKTGRKTASKAKAEVIEKNEEKIANDTSEKKAAVQNDAPKKVVSPRRGRPRKKAAPAESENA